MSRLAALWKASPRRALAALAALTVASAVAVGSGANFTSHSANPSNTLTAGNLAQVNSRDGSAILSVSAMKPGDTSNGTVTITNSGDVPGAFSLSKASLGDTPGANGGVLSGKLHVLVEDVTDPASPAPVYSGKVDAMGTQGLGTLAAGAARTYRFTVSFPDGGIPATDTTGDNAFKGSSMTVRYDWDAAS